MVDVRKTLAALLVCVVMSLPWVAHATPPTVNWVSWTAPGSYPLNGILADDPYEYTYTDSATGTLTLPDTTVVNVTLSGEVLDQSCFTATSAGCPSGFWHDFGWAGYPDVTFTSTNVPSPPPNVNLIVQAGYNLTQHTVTFSQPVTNVVMNIMSLGSVGHPSAYQFTQDFSILSQDGNCNTESNANCMAKSGTTLTGEEGAGTIEFFGTYSSISWTVTVPEYYSGFNIGVTSVAANHTVTFDANGGSGSMTDQAGKVSAALTANSFTRTGYNFAGWNSAAPGGGNAYADGASYAFTADVILYAQWTANPTITMGDTMSYRIGSGAKVIDQGTPATVTDTNVSNFNTGKLTVTVSGATGNDVLGILTGTGTGTFSVSSNIVTYDTGSGPLVIGTISGGTNGNPLEVTFTSSNATPPRVSALLNSITYANASLTNVTQRTVSFTVKDSGGTSAPSAVTITLTRPGFHQLWG